MDETQKAPAGRVRSLFLARRAPTLKLTCHKTRPMHLGVAKLGRSTAPAACLFRQLSFEYIFLLNGTKKRKELKRLENKPADKIGMGAYKKAEFRALRAIISAMVGKNPSCEAWLLILV